MARTDDARPMAEVLDRLDRLEAENRELRRIVSGSAAPPPTTAGTPIARAAGAGDDAPDPEPRANGRIDRRQVLRTGLAAAGAAAAAGAVLLDAAPAGAANGDALILGQPNAVTNPTLLAVNGTGPSYAYGIAVADNGYAGTLYRRPALFAYAKGSYFDTGLQVLADTGPEGTKPAMVVQTQGSPAIVASAGQGTVMQATSSGGDGHPTIQASNIGTNFGVAVSVESGGSAGVFSVCTSGIGVDGQTTNGTGVRGYSSRGTGMKAQSDAGRGIEVDGATTGVVARGNGSAAFGVEAYAATGTGLKARGSAFGVIAQSLTTDPTQAALFASATAGMGIGCATDSGLALSAKSGTGGGAQVEGPAFHVRLSNAATRNAPTSDTIAHQRGDLVETTAGDLWLCTTAGTPGTWRKVSGPSTAGAFHVLPAPVRIYDSRPGTAPAIGPKTPLSGNVARTLDATVNGTGVPVDATAVSVTVLLVNAANASGNMTIWSNGAARPASNTMVWGGSAARFTALAISALSAGKLQISASAQTDVVLDIVGYYR